MPKIDVICKNCGKIKKDYLSSKRKFCSLRCAKEYQKKTIIKKCLVCGKEFKTLPCHIKAGNGKYCSISCFRNKNNKIEKKCFFCNKKYFVFPHRKYSKFCSKQCKYHFNSGWSKSFGKRKSLYKPKHVNSNNQGGILESRYMMSKYIGRPLTKEEVVHHINRDVSDNSQENLILFPSNTAHSKFHQIMRNIVFSFTPKYI